MTGLTKAVTRRTAATVRRRTIVVTLHDRYMVLRELGTRTPFVLSYEAAFTIAAQKAADKQRAEKKAAKQQASAERREAKRA